VRPTVVAGQLTGFGAAAHQQPALATLAARMAAIRIIQPASGHIQLPVDHGMAGIAGVQELDGDLGVLDAAGGAGVLALQPNRLHVHELRVDQQSTTAGPRP
jgi:hypothetical protein